MTETDKSTETHKETETDTAGATEDGTAALTEETAEELEEASVEALVAAWRDELGDQGSVSASDVQDRLLDLWGTLPDGDARSHVERWLTETLARHLYAVDDVQRRLETVLASA